MAQDYTEVQPVLDTLQQALDEALGGRLLVPGGVLEVRGVDDVRGVVSAAHLFGGRVVLGAAHSGALALNLSGLSAVRDLDITSGVVTAEAGMTPAALEAALNAEGMTLGAGHFASPDGSLGAAISAGEGVALTVSIGAVLPDGTLFNTPVAPRRATGPDPVFLLLGTEGRLAVVVWVTLRIFPRAQDPVTVAYSGRGAALLEAVRLAYRAGVRPVSVQLRKAARGRARVTVVVDRHDDEGRFAQQMTDAGAKTTTPDDPVPPAGRPRRLGWRALGALARGQKHKGLWIGPFDLHGGWARTPGDAPAGDVHLDRLQRVVDPLGTLRLHPAAAEDAP